MSFAALGEQHGPSIMVKIWGRANSNNVKKVLWCAEEASVAYERLDAGGNYGVVDTDTFGAMNPNRRVPVLEDGALILWESNTIVRYLAAKYAPDTLYRIDPAARALADRWMDWSSVSFAPSFVTVFRNFMRVSPDQRDLPAMATAATEAGRTLRIADAALRECPFLSGTEFGMGDIPLGCLIHAWFNLPISRPELENLTRWYKRLLMRPSYRKTVAVMLS